MKLSVVLLLIVSAYNAIAILAASLSYKSDDKLSMLQAAVASYEGSDYRTSERLLQRQLAILSLMKWAQLLSIECKMKRALRFLPLSELI